MVHHGSVRLVPLVVFAGRAARLVPLARVVAVVVEHGAVVVVVVVGGVWYNAVHVVLLLGRLVVKLLGIS